jgi:hypothetical protein
VKVLQHMQSKADIPAGQKRCCRVLMPLIVMGATVAPICDLSY